MNPLLLPRDDAGHVDHEMPNANQRETAGIHSFMRIWLSMISTIIISQYRVP